MGVADRIPKDLHGLAGARLPAHYKLWRQTSHGPRKFSRMDDRQGSPMCNQGMLSSVLAILLSTPSTAAAVRGAEATSLEVNRR